MARTLRMLWMSDIHYMETFRSDLDLKKRNDEFFKVVTEYLEKLKENKNGDDKLQYFILSGDIAYSGKKEEYELFNEKIITELKKIFERFNQSPVLLFCPGNHDLDRSKDELYKKFIKAIDDSYKINNGGQGVAPATFETVMESASRQQVLNDYGIEEAKKIFESYSNYVGNFFGEFTPKKLNFENYKKNNYQFGYLIDDENKIIFTILNSAWFSLGDAFNKQLVDYYEKNEKENSATGSIMFTRGDLTKIIELKDKCSEYGRQVVNTKIIKEENYNSNFNKLPEYLSITIFHHPLSWLEDSQKTDWENPEKDTPLISLLKKSDILLTGHEHVSINTTPERLYNSLIHIPGGMYIHDNNRYYDGGQNRFHILEIDTRNRKLDIINYFWSYEAKIWENYSISDKDKDKKWKGIPVDNRPSHFIYQKGDNKYIRRYKEDFNTSLFLNQFMNAKLPDNNDLNWEMHFVDNQNEEVFYTTDFKTPTQAFLIIKSLTSASKLLSSNNHQSIYEKIVSFAKNLEHEKLKQHVIFLQLDILAEKEEADCEDEKRASYFSKQNRSDSGFDFKSDEEVLECYSRLQKISDARINLFRNDFFYNHDPYSKLNKTYINKDNFPYLKKIAFGNFLIPFWSLDTYTKK